MNSLHEEAINAKSSCETKYYRNASYKPLIQGLISTFVPQVHRKSKGGEARKPRRLYMPILRCVPYRMRAMKVTLPVLLGDV